MFSPDDVNGVRMFCLMLGVVSGYVIARPDRFGMRLGFARYPLPNSRLATVLGALGLTFSLGLFGATLL